jgi:hypothetical protein
MKNNKNAIISLELGLVFKVSLGSLKDGLLKILLRSSQGDEDFKVLFSL